MVNDPMPWQMTVAELRSILENANSGAVVSLKVPAGGIGHPELETYLNVTVVDRGPIVVLQPNLSKRN